MMILVQNFDFGYFYGYFIAIGHIVTILGFSIHSVIPWIDWSRNHFFFLNPKLIQSYFYERPCFFDQTILPDDLFTETINHVFSE